MGSINIKPKDLLNPVITTRESFRASKNINTELKKQVKGFEKRIGVKSSLINRSLLS